MSDTTQNTEPSRSVLFVCSKHGDPAPYEECMACGTLACLSLLWRSCEVSLDMGEVRAAVRSFGGDAEVPA